MSVIKNEANTDILFSQSQNHKSRSDGESNESNKSLCSTEYLYRSKIWRGHGSIVFGSKESCNHAIMNVSIHFRDKILIHIIFGRVLKSPINRGRQETAKPGRKTMTSVDEKWMEIEDVRCVSSLLSLTNPVCPVLS